MRIYEELFIVDPKATEEQIDGVIGQIEEFVREAGGTIDKVDKWGIRKLAYRINKREEGYYVLVQFSAGAETIRELERRLRVEELVLKYLTVRIDEKRPNRRRQFRAHRRRRRRRRRKKVQEVSDHGGNQGRPAHQRVATSDRH